MKKFLLASLACLLLVAPLELSAKHVVKHHKAVAQTAGCGVGQTPPSTGCGLGDMSVGPAVSGTDSIAICQQAGGCPASSTTWQLTKQPMSAIATYISGVTGGGGLSGMTAGQVPIANSPTQVNKSLPLANASATKIGTAAGTLTSGHCVSINSTNDFVDAGGACTTSSGSFTPITLAPGLTSTPGTYNTGTQTVASGGSISPQLMWESHTSSYTVLTTDSGKLLEASGGGVTFTLPTAGAVGSGGYSFKFAGSAYTVTTQSGNNIYGCGVTSGAGTTPPNSITVNFDISVVPTSNTPNTWACIPNVSQTIVTAPYGPGMNMATAPIPIALRGVPVQLISVICVPGNLVPATPAYIDLYSCANGVLPGTGSCTTPVTTSHCAAGTGGAAATLQSLSFPAGTTIPGGNIAWAVGSGSGWSGSLTSSSGLFEIGTSP